MRQRILKVYGYNRIRKRYSETTNYERTARRLLVSVDSVQKYVKLFRRIGSLRTYYEINKIKHGKNRTYACGDLIVLKLYIVFG